MSESDEELAHSAINGDGDALQRLLKKYEMQLRASIAGLISDRWQPLISEDDVIQETYLDAFLSIKQFSWRGYKAFIGWLVTIAKNNIREAIRGLENKEDKRIQSKTSNQEDLPPAYNDLLGDYSLTPSRDARRKEAISDLGRAIRKLPPEYAKVITLYDLDQRPPSEVANLLGCSQGALFMRRARAIRRIHEIMGHTSKYFTK